MSLCSDGGTAGLRATCWCCRQMHGRAHHSLPPSPHPSITPSFHPSIISFPPSAMHISKKICRPCPLPGRSRWRDSIASPLIGRPPRARMYPSHFRGRDSSSSPPQLPPQLPQQLPQQTRRPPSSPLHVPVRAIRMRSGSENFSFRSARRAPVLNLVAGVDAKVKCATLTLSTQR